MLATRVVILACCLAATEACQTQTDPTTGRTIITTASLGQILGVQAAPSTQLASAAGYAPTTGVERYRQVLGPKTTDLALTHVAGGQWTVDLSMLLTDPTCVGEVHGRAVEQSPGLLVMSSDRQGNRCSLQIRRGLGTASVGEFDCSADHGASCEFGGDLARVN